MIRTERRRDDRCCGRDGVGDGVVGCRVGWVFEEGVLGCVDKMVSCSATAAEDIRAVATPATPEEHAHLLRDVCLN